MANTYFDTHAAVNNAVKQAIGESEFILAEDLGNIVDAGAIVLSDRTGTEKFTDSICQVIGKTIFSSEKVKRKLDSIYVRDGALFGSILRKINISTVIEAEEDPTYTLEDGDVVEMQRFKRPQVNSKFYNHKDTWMLNITIMRKTLETAFNSAGDMDAFISMLWENFDNSINLQLNELTARLLNTLIGQCNKDSRVVNLRDEYNTAYTKTLTAEEFLRDPDALRYAIVRINNIANNMREHTRLYNGEGNLTAANQLSAVYHARFANAIPAYLYSTTYNFNEIPGLPGDTVETTAKWQNIGTAFDFDDTSAIDVKLPDGTSVELSGIIGVLFDRRALMVYNEMQSLDTAPYNSVGRYQNTTAHIETSLYFDNNYNSYVFTIEDDDEDAGA